MKDCPDDIVHQLLQGKATDEERRVYLAHVEDCDDCRLELVLARDFDAVLVTQPGDDEIATRIGARVARAPRRSGRRFVWAAAAILLGTAGAAAGTNADLRKSLTLRFFGEKSEESRPFPPAPRTSAHPPPSVSPEEKPLAPPVDAEDEEAAKVVPGPALKKSPERAMPQNSAAELFASANTLRRAGRSAEAQKIYSTLLQRHPKSQEALVSHVSLGRLVKGSAPAQALQHFNAYLGQSGHTTLAAEALYGKASALAALGDTAAEKATWRQLLQRFPSSVYAERARAQLEK